MIIYNKLLEELDKQKITSYMLRNKGINGEKVSGATWDAIRANKPINVKTIDFFCRILKCQPGDLMEYVEDE